MGQYSLFGGDAPEVGEVVLALPEGSGTRRSSSGSSGDAGALHLRPPAALRWHLAAPCRHLGRPRGLWEQPDGAAVTIGGMVGAINRRFTRNGEAMLFFECEDLEGSVDRASPRWPPRRSGIRQDAIVVVSGRLDHRGDDIKVVAREIKELEVRGADEVRLEIPAAALSPRAVGRLKEILGNHPGTSPVFLHMVANGNHKVLRLGDEHRASRAAPSTPSCASSSAPEPSSDKSSAEDGSGLASPKLLRSFVAGLSREGDLATACRDRAGWRD